MASVMTGDISNGCSEAKVSGWANPKLTVGEALDLQIQEARRHLEQLCVKKAKLEAMDWLNHPYHEVQKLLSIDRLY